MMRLLKRSPNDDLELISFTDDNAPSYAILSHTWIDGEEVTYGELMAGACKETEGFAKISFCVEQASKDNLEYCWVDTCCIDKSSCNELNTTINSMFRYYQRAAKCYVYLSDVQVPEEVADASVFRISWEDAFRRSRWFTRGWTLQELLAPVTVEFFSKNKRRLGSRITLEKEIHEVTEIPIDVLRGKKQLSEFSIDERMRWAEKRRTTVKEDKVYCLLGIFGVFLPLIYGEGESYATLRLREEIQRRQEGRGTESLQDLTGPLSFTASVVTVIGAAKAVSVGLNKLRIYLVASEGLLQLINEVADIQALAHKIDVIIAEYLRTGQNADEALEGLTPLVDQTRETIRELTTLVESITGSDIEALSPAHKPQVSKKAWRKHNEKAFRFADRLFDHRHRLIAHLTIIPIFQHFKQRHDLQAVDALLSKIEQMIEARSAPLSTISSHSVPQLASDSTIPLAGTRVEKDPQGQECFSIETLTWSKQCNQSCPCQCHCISTVTMPNWIRSFVGTLFARYSGIPRFGTTPCNIMGCIRGNASIRLTYFFPARIMTKVLSFNATWSGWTQIRFALNTPNVVEDTYGIWNIIRKDNRPLLWKLFQIRDFSPLDVSEDGETYLHFAIQAKSFNIIGLLLDLGLDVHAPDRNNRTPIRLAWELARRDIADDDKMVLRRLCIDDDEVLISYGFGLLHQVVLGLRSGALLDEPDIINPFLNSTDSHGWTPLHWAASCGETRVVMKLLSLGASVHSTNNLGETALHLAITNGYTYCARILVDAGASVFARTAELETPLHRAAMQPAVFPEVLEFLINGDFDIDVLDDVGITPLSIASRFNNLPGVRALLECGADVNLANVNGNTPLISAVSHNALETSTYLCSRGADLTVVNIWGYNIFHQIAYGAGIEIIDVLKDVDLTGVDSDLSDEEGITPIEAFIRWRDTNFSGKRGDRDEELAAFRYLLDKARLSRPCCTAFIGPKEKQE